MKHKLLITFSFFALTVQAQSTFTDYLATTRAGQGKVVIHQTKYLERLVNNLASPNTASRTTTTTNEASSQGENASKKSAETAKNTLKHKNITSGTRTNAEGQIRRRKGTGYRIQIYTGGNSRADRMTAEKYGRLCRKEFPELIPYAHFASPRWICRVGDFRTQEEAAEYAAKLRKEGIFPEVSVVKSTIWLP